ncbi:hypothetical protein DICA3_F36994 [Diutina catenulata]
MSSDDEIQGTPDTGYEANIRDMLRNHLIRYKSFEEFYPYAEFQKETKGGADLYSQFAEAYNARIQHVQKSIDELDARMEYSVDESDTTLTIDDLAALLLQVEKECVNESKRIDKEIEQELEKIEKLNQNLRQVTKETREAIDLPQLEQDLTNAEKKLRLS